MAALASNAELLILDEPTSGLDPLMEAVFQDEVAKEKEKGCTVLLSSHILTEVENLADRVSIIRRGRIVQTGTLDELRGQSLVSVVLADPPADVAELPMLRDAHLDGHGRLQASLDPDRVGDAMAALAPLGMSSLSVAPASLEELFLNQYEQKDK